MNEYDDIADRLESFDLRISDFNLKTRKKEVRDVYIYGNGLMRTVLKLLAAGNYSIHISEMRPDHLARLEQHGVPYQCFKDEERGTGDAKEWVCLDRSGDRSFTFTNVVQKVPTP